LSQRYTIPSQSMTAVLGHEEVAPGHFLLALEAEAIARSCAPGQFVMVRVGQEMDPLLRRPFSLHFARANTIGLLYRVVGKGTSLLSRLKEGASIDVIGPLGKGFSIPESLDRLILIAGGIGVAPLYFAAEKVRRERPQTRVSLFYGARTQGELIRLQAFAELGVETYLATEDGTAGARGFVTRILRETSGALDAGHFMACGPEPMLKALTALPWRGDQSLQVSLESNMACGMGACLGCAVQTTSGYKHVCQDGPVFEARTLPW